MKTNKFNRSVALTLGLLGAAGVAVANDTTSGHSGLETLSTPQIHDQFIASPGITYNSEADFDDSAAGNVSVWRFDVPVRYTMKTDTGEFGIGAFYEYSAYDFSALSDDQDFNTLSVNAFWKSMFNEEWGYFVVGGVGASASTDADMDDGFTGFGGGGATYVCSSNLNFGLGVAAASQLEDDATALPIIIVNWKINEDWNLKVLNGVTLSYDISHEKKVILDLGANYKRRTYRLDDDAAAIDKQVSVELGCTYRFSPEFALRGFAGVAAGRNYEIRQDDDKVGDEDVDAAPFFGVRAILTF